MLMTTTSLPPLPFCHPLFEDDLPSVQTPLARLRSDAEAAALDALNALEVVTSNYADLRGSTKRALTQAWQNWNDIEAVRWADLAVSSQRREEADEAKMQAYDILENRASVVLNAVTRLNEAERAEVADLKSEACRSKR